MRIYQNTKQMTVKILKFLSEIAAMTGDGVNDVPALKKGDLGIAMGLAGMEVAKETHCMFFRDDTFSSLVSAVEEGRMKAFIR